MSPSKFVARTSTEMRFGWRTPVVPFAITSFPAFDGDKSPSEGGENSPHSKNKADGTACYFAAGGLVTAAGTALVPAGGVGGWATFGGKTVLYFTGPGR